MPDTHNDHAVNHCRIQCTQDAKQVVLSYCRAFDQAPDNELHNVLADFTDQRYHLKSLHPLGKMTGISTAVSELWQPLRSAFTALERRPDIFFANRNTVPWSGQGSETDRLEHEQSVWTCQMGHFMGLMDQAWMDIPATGRMVFLRYTEFHRVFDNKIQESALFFDLIGVMRQAGHYPLPPCTGASFIYPGPQTHDGLLFEPQPDHASTQTQSLIDRMVADLSASNELSLKSGDNQVPRDVLARSWSDDMVWYGPEGIGATYTIDRYQQQHQYPFRFNLSGKQFNGHIARFSEGHYGAFFGWPNLSNTASGGFLGLPGSGVTADMRVTDVYRREGDRLKENWVIIDLPHWLSMQGLDILQRMRQLLGKETIGR